MSIASPDTISDGFAQILALYGTEKPRAPISKDHPIFKAFDSLASVLRDTDPVKSRRTFIVDWSVGRGGKARVPWIAFLDKRLTTSTRNGVYAVYLFREDLAGVYLTLNQGVTSSEKQFYTVSRTHRGTLRAGAQALKQYAEGLQERGFTVGESIDLATESDLGLAYEAGAFAAKLYERAALPGDLDLLGDLDAVLSKYEAYVNSGAPLPPDIEPPSPPTVPETIVAPAKQLRTMDWLVEQTLWPREELEALVNAIRGDWYQCVLAGPPGTGKTWLGQRVAEYITQGESQLFRTVQFHPSYSYEEFIEGLRPMSAQGTITFQPVPGVVLRFVDAIASTPGPHILLIDELNRANLPKVLGELMYLFEYRNQKLALRFRRQFSLPDSLRFIGTMNTADRSIRSIDTALRRRFQFVECPPRRDILERYFQDGGNDVSDLLDGFERLNALLKELRDRHHTIGHTFFMRKPFTTDTLNSVWDHQLAPLIEEYFFDQPDFVEKFSVKAIWPKA